MQKLLHPLNGAVVTVVVQTEAESCFVELYFIMIQYFPVAFVRELFDMFFFKNKMSRILNANQALGSLQDIWHIVPMDNSLMMI